MITFSSSFEGDGAEVTDSGMRTIGTPDALRRPGNDEGPVADRPSVIAPFVTRSAALRDVVDVALHAAALLRGYAGAGIATQSKRAGIRTLTFITGPAASLNPDGAFECFPTTR